MNPERLVGPKIMNDLAARLRMVRLLFIGHKETLKGCKQRRSIRKFRKTVFDVGLRMNWKEDELKQKDQLGECCTGQ